MSVKGDRSDIHISEAIDYAIKNKPCVISCKTLAAMEQAALILDSLGHKVRMIRVATPHREAVERRNLFESGLIDYLVINSSLLYAGPMKFRRAGCFLASADALAAPRQSLFSSLLGQDAEARSRVFSKRVQRKAIDVAQPN